MCRVQKVIEPGTTERRVTWESHKTIMKNLAREVHQIQHLSSVTKWKELVDTQTGNNLILPDKNQVDEETRIKIIYNNETKI